MKLQYRGITYKPQSCQIKTIDTGITARFLGNSYSIHRSRVNYQSQLGLRKYRGISYGC